VFQPAAKKAKYKSNKYKPVWMQLFILQYNETPKTKYYILD